MANLVRLKRPRPSAVCKGHILPLEVEHVGTHVERLAESHGVHESALLIYACFEHVETVYTKLGLRYGDISDDAVVQPNVAWR